jgi:hypothetical protein
MEIIFVFLKDLLVVGIITFFLGSLYYNDEKNKGIAEKDRPEFFEKYFFIPFILVLLLATIIKSADILDIVLFGTKKVIIGNIVTTIIYSLFIGYFMINPAKLGVKKFFLYLVRLLSMIGFCLFSGRLFWQDIIIAKDSYLYFDIVGFTLFFISSFFLLRGPINRIKSANNDASAFDSVN